MDESGRITLPLLLIAWSFPGYLEPVLGEPGDLIQSIPLPFSGAVGLARDGDDGTFWLTNALDGRVYHFTAGLSQAPENFPVNLSAEGVLRGIAFNSRDHTLLVADGFAAVIIEHDKEGNETGRRIVVPRPDVPLDPNDPRQGRHVIAGIAFAREGNRGTGSLFITVGAWQFNIISEMDLDGRLLRSFPPPDDPERFLGPSGSRFNLTGGLDAILGGDRLSGLWAAASAAGGRLNALLKLDLDGKFTGISIPLGAAGGNVTSAFLSPWTDPRLGKQVEAFICVSNQPQISILEAGEPRIQGIRDFQCEVAGRTVQLSWTPAQGYDAIEIVGECGTVASLPGDATGWSGSLETDGEQSFSARVIRGLSAAQSPFCTVVAGPGQILDSKPLAGDIAGVKAIYVDLDSDLLGNLIVLEYNSRRLLFYDYDLNYLGESPISDLFAPPGFELSAVAYGGKPETVYVYNETAGTIGRLSFSGEFLDEFPSPLSNLTGSFNFVAGGLAFDPQGDGGSGSLWILEAHPDQIHEMALQGMLIRTIPHPTIALDPPPANFSGIPAWGLSTIEGSPGELFTSGGTFSENRLTRFFRLSVDSGEVVRASEFPISAVGDRRVSCQFVLKAGKPRLLAIGHRRLPGGDYDQEARLMELEADSPAVPAPVLIACGAGDVDRAELEFINNGPYGAVEVRRDCELVGVLDGGAARYVEAGAPPGLHRYEVRGRIGERLSAPAGCKLRLGIGAILEMKPSIPCKIPHHISRHPLDGTYYLSDAPVSREQRLYRFDGDLNFVEGRPLNSQDMEISTFAIRAEKGQVFFYYILRPHNLDEGWKVDDPFTFSVEGEDGLIVRNRQLEVPRPSTGLTWPAGLVWDPVSDTFFFHERRANVIFGMDPDGEILSSFPHPDPPGSFQAEDTGMAISVERRTLFLTTAIPGEIHIGRAVEIGFTGRLTGYQISLPEGKLLGEDIHGISISGRDLIAAGPFEPFAAIFKIAGFLEAPRARLFIRGDANDDGGVDISDAIALLKYLYLGSDEPPCHSAADGNDDGALDVSDAIFVLSHLFLGQAEPPPPFPEPGVDPTPDALPCVE